MTECCEVLRDGANRSLDLRVVKVLGSEHRQGIWVIGTDGPAMNTNSESTSPVSVK